MNILKKIVAATRERVDRAKEIRSAESLREDAAGVVRPGKSRFLDALRRTDNRMRVIAELKKASPSAGLIRADFEPISLATEYFTAGADALSVLTEPDFFQGKPDYLISVRRELPEIPILRKDFIIDEYQLLEAAAWGADAVLLIAATLDDATLRSFIACADELDLAALVEVHNEQELGRAINIGVELIGINNRNLKTFEVDIRQTERLCRLIENKEGVIIVSESGIKTKKDIDFLLKIGVDCILIGETLMRADSPGHALHTLIFSAMGNP